MIQKRIPLLGLILSILFTIVIESPTNAQTTLFTAQTQAGYDTVAGFRQNVTASYYHQDSTGFILYSFGLVTKSWGELRFGLGYGKSIPLIGYLEAGLSIGLETDLIPIRGDAYLFWKSQNQQWKGLLDIERGGSGWWHLVFLERKLSKNFSLGLRAQKFYVTGIMAAWDIPKTPLKIWGAGGYMLQSDGQPIGGMVGLSAQIE